MSDDPERRTAGYTTSYRQVPNRELRVLIGSYAGRVRSFPQDVAEYLVADGRAQDPEIPWSPRLRKPDSGVPATPGITHSTAALAVELREIKALLGELVQQGGARRK